MIKTFIFESDHFATDGLCNQIEIEVDIQVMSMDEYDHVIGTIFDNTANLERQLKDFPSDEQTRIESMAQNVFENNIQDALEDLSARAYDKLKDRMKYGD